jgi:hypothetical protein
VINRLVCHKLEALQLVCVCVCVERERKREKESVRACVRACVLKRRECVYRTVGIRGQRLKREWGCDEVTNLFH